MKKLTSLLILSGVVSMPVFAADAPASPHTLTGNFGITTDYIFRGISQTQHKPAVSGGIDYSHASGIYLGTWLSNQSWVQAVPVGKDSSLEIDLYGGYRGAAGDISYDVGLIRYQYPHTSTGVPTPNTTEAYMSGSWKFLSLKYSHVLSDYFIGWTPDGTTKTRGSNYLELNANYDLGNGWGMLGHIGHQKVRNAAGADYTDWKVGISKDIGFGLVTLAYSDTNADPRAQVNGADAYIWTGKDVSKSVAALSFSKTF